METSEPRKSELFDIFLPKLEVMAWGVAILGLIAKCNLIREGNLLLIIGLGCLSNAYAISAFKPRTMPQPYGEFSSVPNEPPSFLIDTLSPKIVGLAGSITLLGILFKLKFWDGSTTMLIVGTVSLLGVAMVTASRQSNSRALLIGVIGALVWYVPEENFIRLFHRDNPVLIGKMVYQSQHPRDSVATNDLLRYVRRNHLSL